MMDSIKDLCRLCGIKVDSLMGLEIFTQDRQLSEKINICLPIQVSIVDIFPKTVCIDCAYKLDVTFSFRERSILTAHLFTEMLKVSNENVLETSKDDECELVTGQFNSDDYINCHNSLKLDAMDAGVNVVDSLKSSSKSDGMEDNLLLVKERMSVLDADDGSSTLLYSDSPEVMEPFHDMANCVDNKDLYSENDKSELLLSTESDLLQTSNDLENRDPDWHYCNICGKAFSENKTFQEHYEEHWHKCSSCSATFTNEEAIKAHQLEMHSKKKIKHKKKGKGKSDGKKCMECGKMFPTNYKLQEHQRKHTGEKPFACSNKDCKKAFRSKIGLAQHEASHSGQYELSCPTCGKGFQCRSYLVVHQRVHSNDKPFHCKQCTQKFKTKQSLLDHMNRHLGVKPFLCDICGRGFITKGLCKSHQKVHSGTDNRQYPCHVCRKLFVSKSYLNTHFRIHTGEKPFICEVCGKGFLTRVDLKIHSTLHTGEKSYVCETCGKAFARRDALRCHRRSHTGERPYKCDYCGQSFTQFTPMSIHKRLHTGQRPYQCDICLKAFVSRSSMVGHKKKNHPDTPDCSEYRLVEVEIHSELVETKSSQDGSPEVLLPIKSE